MPEVQRPTVLVVHNAYQQRGGEDSVVEAEVELLRQHGHRVVEYRRSNDDIEGMSRLAAGAQTFWSRRTVSEVGQLLAHERIDIVHCHNTFPLISPSVYWAGDRAGVPVVQTLHNFRLICPQALMLRNDRPCEDCVGKAVPLPAVRHACYRGSRAQSAALVGMLGVHRALGTWQHKVSRYIALNEFCRERFIAGGLPAERIVVKPNFVDAGPAPDAEADREGVLFVGRLSHEKGVAVLAEAMRRLNGAVPLRVVGAGPLASLLEGVPGVRMLGALSPSAVLAEMRRARLLVLPSIWYENFPRTLVEAFASGLPVVASRLGAMATLIRHGADGLLVPSGDADALAQCLLRQHPDVQGARRLGAGARERFEREMSPDVNYRLLFDIYAQAMNKSG